MIPIRDYLPTERRPVVTVAIILICIAVFVGELARGEEGFTRAVYGLGMIPAVLTGEARLAPELALVPAWLTPLTSMFLHGGWLHLGGNMLYLWIFGNNVEDRLGHLGFALFYLGCGALAALGHVLLDPTSRVPMVGASGAISGVLAAYLVFFPRARVLVVVPIGFLFATHLPASLLLGFWFLLQFLSAVGSEPGTPGIAWWAHVAGFVAGLAVALLLRLRSHDRSARRRPGPWG